MKLAEALIERKALKQKLVSWTLVSRRATLLWSY